MIKIPNLTKLNNSGMRVYAFVGPSGTGKSYRAQQVATENNIDFIIDDGILVHNSDMVAGSSAKKAPTKIETVKRALFINPEQKKEMRKAIRKYSPDSILILGTSDGMVKEIAENLGLPKIEKTIYINDVATEEEIKTARHSRKNEGKHVIPVPTFEIKKDFSGYLLDPLQIFQKTPHGKTKSEEKSIIRPTFSYLGKYTISDMVFKQIIEYQASKLKGVYILKIRVNNAETGPSIYVEAEIDYGINIQEEIEKLKKNCMEDLERQTTMSVRDMQVVIKKIRIDQ